MKKIFYLIYFLPTFIVGQGIKLSNEMLCSPVFFTTNSGTGSGVFLADSSRIFFVTARHVLYSENENNNQTPQFSLNRILINLVFYPRNVTSGNNAVISIDLSQQESDTLVAFDNNHDIAVIFLGRNKVIGNGLFLTKYFPQINKDKSTHIPTISTTFTIKYDSVDIGSDTYLFGYPESIGLQKNPQFDYQRPLLRKGIIAGKYDKRKTLIIDSPVYWGNSGGPVFEFTTDDISTIPVTYKIGLIGIVSEYIPYVSISENKLERTTNIQKMNSGYSVITSIDYALDLMKKFK